MNIKKYDESDISNMFNEAGNFDIGLGRGRLNPFSSKRNNIGSWVKEVLMPDIEKHLEWTNKKSKDERRTEIVRKFQFPLFKKRFTLKLRHGKDDIRDYTEYIKEKLAEKYENRDVKKEDIKVFIEKNASQFDDNLMAINIELGIK